MMTGCLILHGFTGSPYEVTPLADYLREHTDWEIEVPVLPGHGPELDLKHVTYRHWLRAAEDALKRLEKKVDTLYLIGFSMGGMIAVYLAAKQTIAKLVLLAPSGKYLAFRPIIRDLTRMVTDTLTGNIAQNGLYLYSKYKWRTVPLKAYVAFLKLIRFTRQFLGDVMVPVLIVHGQQDIMVPYQTARYLDMKIPSKQKRIVLFEQSGHMLCLGDDGAVLNRMVYGFLRS